MTVNLLSLHSYPCPKLAALQVDYIPYLDAIAKEVGVCPNIAWLLLRDPAVGLRVFFGPCTPYQFRLSGPGTGKVPVRPSLPNGIVWPTHEDTAHSRTFILQFIFLAGLVRRGCSDFCFNGNAKEDPTVSEYRLDPIDIPYSIFGYLCFVFLL